MAMFMLMLLAGLTGAAVPSLFVYIERNRRIETTRRIDAAIAALEAAREKVCEFEAKMRIAGTYLTGIGEGTNLQLSEETLVQISEQSGLSLEKCRVIAEAGARSADTIAAEWARELGK